MSVSGLVWIIAWLVVSAAMNVLIFTKLFPQVERYRRHSNIVLAVLHEATRTITMGLLLAVYAFTQADPDGLLKLISYYWLGLGVFSLAALLLASKFNWGTTPR